MASAVLPGVVVAAGPWLLLAAVDLPIVGFFAGLAAGVDADAGSIELLEPGVSLGTSGS